MIRDLCSVRGAENWSKSEPSWRGLGLASFSGDRNKDFLIYLLICFLSLLSIAMIKHHDPKQHGEEKIVDNQGR